MTSVQALVVCAAVSLVLSLILVVAIAAPLRAFIQSACAGPEAVNFWSRFTLIMLFLSPLFCAVAFGLPPPSLLKNVELGQLFQRAVTSSIVGAFLVMLAIGIWVSVMAGRQPPPPPAPRRQRTDDEL